MTALLLLCGVLAVALPMLLAALMAPDAPPQSILNMVPLHNQEVYTALSWLGSQVTPQQRDPIVDRLKGAIKALQTPTVELDRTKLSEAEAKRKKRNAKRKAQREKRNAKSRVRAAKR